jgi:hypothetical protein
MGADMKDWIEARLIDIPLYNHLEHFIVPPDTDIDTINQIAVERWGTGAIAAVLYVNAPEPCTVVSKM